MARLGLIFALVGLALCGCGTTSTVSPDREARAAVTGAPEAVAPADAARLASDNATFAGRILELLARTHPTLALSPFSISDVLAMAYAGAEGRTASQMASALDFRLPPARLHPALGALGRSLTAVNRPGATLSIANALYGQQSTAFRGAFLGVLGRDYGTGVRTVDFKHALPGARARINAWVSESTKGRIPRLIAPGDLSQATRLVLVNAVYLNAKWQSPFVRGNTSPVPFHAPGATIEVPTMHQTGTFGYRRHVGYSVLELPYVGGRLAFDVLLPDAGALPALLHQLGGGGLPAAVSGLREQSVALQLPKLQLRTRFDLSSALGTLGMPIAFGGQADFSGIAGPPGALRISSVIHEAYIRVDEAGTQAAAATAAGFATAQAVGPPPTQFLVNRPFVFVLRDTTTDAALFAGTVSRP